VNTEKTPAYLNAFQAADELYRGEDEGSFDLAPCVSGHVKDGNPGAQEACQVFFGPDCGDFRDLPHAKRNVTTKAAKWQHGNQGAKVTLWMECSAFWPSNTLRHIYWARHLQRLSGVGIRSDDQRAEPKIVEYLIKHQVPLSDQGYHSARWFSSWLETSPGRSTHLGNVIESLWSKMDAHHAADEAKKDFLNIFKEIRDDAAASLKQGGYGNVFPTPQGPHIYQPDLMRGLGIWQAKSALYDEGFRRSTVQKLREAAAEGKQVYLESGAVEGLWVRSWVFSKRSPYLTEEDLAMAPVYRDLLASNSIDRTMELLERAHCIYDGYASTQHIRLFMARFTILIEEIGGGIVDLHRDFMIKAISEHWLLQLSAYGGQFGKWLLSPRRAVHLVAPKGSSWVAGKRRFVGDHIRTY